MLGKKKTAAPEVQQQQNKPQTLEEHALAIQTLLSAVSTGLVARQQALGVAPAVVANIDLAIKALSNTAAVEANFINAQVGEGTRRILREKGLLPETAATQELPTK